MYNAVGTLGQKSEIMSLNLLILGGKEVTIGASQHGPWFSPEYPSICMEHLFS